MWYKIRLICEPEEVRADVLMRRRWQPYRGWFVPHAKVAKWLGWWGTSDELPCPTPEPH